MARTKNIRLAFDNDFSKCSNAVLRFLGKEIMGFNSIVVVPSIFCLFTIYYTHILYAFFRTREERNLTACLSMAIAHLWRVEEMDISL